MKRFLFRPSRAFLQEAAKAAGFAALLVVLLSSFFSAFRFKYGDGIYSIEKFYELEDNTVDVLVLGSSHAFEDINPAVLYADYGIAAYDLCGSVQPMWNTYYYLTEALKTQQPRLVILEAFCTSFTDSYSDESRIIKNTFGMKPSLNWLGALRASVPGGKLFEYLFQFYRYHSRYAADLSEKDFLENQGMALYQDWKGFGCNFSHAAQAIPDALSLHLDSEPLYEKTETYYRKIIELCQSRSIPLEIVVSPYAVSPEEQRLYLTAESIAAEYDVPFTNYNDPALQAEISFDYALHMADSAHLNSVGNVLFSRHLGSQFTEKYDLPDRRGDARYASWDRNAQYFQRTLKNHALSELQNLHAYTSSIASDPGYTVFVSISGYCAEDIRALSPILHQLGAIPADSDAPPYGTWAVSNQQVLACYQEDMNRPYVELDGAAFTLCADHVLTPDGISSACDGCGIRFAIYDHVTQTVADIVSFNAHRAFSADRPERSSAVF